MKGTSSNFSKRLFTTLLSLIAILQVTAQSSTPIPLKDFVLFGKEGVNIAGATVDGGSIGSNIYVNTTSGPTIGAHVYSHGTVTLSNNTSIKGKLYAGPMTVPSSFSGVTLSGNSSGLLSRNIYVNGNINLGSGYQVKGTVTQPSGATYSGPSLSAGQLVTANPNIPGLPVIAVETMPSFTGNQNVINTTTLLPNAQRKDVSLNGNKTLTFKGVGKYYLNSINNSNSNTIEFDFNGNTNPADYIEVYVKSTVALGKSNVIVTNGGSAARVIMRVWGTGTAFNISNGNSGGIEWQGTVYAFNGDINLSSGGNATKVIGALFSNKTITMGSSIQVIYASLDPCGLNVDAGPEGFIQDCPNSTVTLTGSGKTGNQISYLWTAEDGGVVPANNTSLTLSGVTAPGTYILTITQGGGGGCPNEYKTASDYTYVTQVPCVQGVIQPPLNGKDETYDVFDKTTTDLDVLYMLNGNIDPSTNVTFQLRYAGGLPTHVLIDVITRPLYTNEVYTTLTTSYGMVDTIYNGSSSVIITGWFPIANLQALNTNSYFSTRVSYVRPVYPAINKGVTGVAGGDLAMGSAFSRGGYNLTGQGYKIGVLSDSYNNKGGALTDVQNGDLPGAAGPTPIINANDIVVLKEYPYGTGSDEGRSMLQIIYDVAPKAELVFRTGFLTAGDFALGIGELVNYGCHAVVDDISFITEPFFVDGVIAQAVKSAVQQGAHYVTAAGNYATKSYESAFVPATGTPLPFGIPGVAHNFGNSIYQVATVKAPAGKPGIYTIGLQWRDDFSSLGAVGTGTDVDLYAINQANEVIGFNRINLNADPMEIMSFVVNPQPTTEVVTDVRLMVVVDGTPPPGLYFKFIVFRGDLTFVNPSAGANAGTIVGQANVPEAHTIGAVRYTTPTVIEPFTSRGGVLYQPTGSTTFSASQKPDYVAPDGVNTSVDMGSLVDPEGDGIKNFFGTSASAPHVAAGIALLLEAQNKYVTSATLTPAQIKDLIRNNVLPIPGTLYERGAGLVRIDKAIGSFANPTPKIEGVQYPNPATATEHVVRVIGSYFLETTEFRLNGVLLPKTFVNDTACMVTIPIFTDKRGLVAHNPRIAVNQNDGGPSNTYYFNSANRYKIIVSAQDKTKKFLAEMPAFTHTIHKRLDGNTTQVTDAAEIASYGLSNITYSTNAVLYSNASASPFNITPVIPVNDTLGKYELYEYEIDFGALFVQPLDVRIKPKDKTVVYGDYIGEIEYEYEILNPMAAENRDLAMAYLEMSHKAMVPSNAIALLDNLDMLNAADQVALRIALGLAPDADANAIRLAFQNALTTQNLAFMVSLKTVLSSRGFDIVSNKMVLAANPSAAQLSVVDLNKASFLSFMANNNSTAIALHQTLSNTGNISRGIVSSSAINNAQVNGYNTLQYQLKNVGYAQTLLSLNQIAQNDYNLVSKLPIYNNKIIHQLHGTTFNGTSATLPQVGIVHYIYSMGLVQQANDGSYVSVAQNQPVLLSDGAIVFNYIDPAYPNVISMKQLLKADAEPMKIALEQKIALATNSAISLKNINGVLQYVDVNNQVVNPNSVIDLNALVTDLSAIALRVPYSSELSVAPDGTYSLNGLTLKLNRIVMAYSPATSGGLGLMVSSGGLGLMVSSGTGGLGLMVSSGGLGLMVSSGGLGLMVSSGGLGLMVSSGGLGLMVSSGGLGLMVSSGGLGLMVSSGGLGLMVTSNGTTNGLANNTPIIFSENEVQNDGFIGPNIGINLVTSLAVGNNYIIGGAFVNSNMIVTNVPGNLNITKAEPTVTVTPGGPYVYDGTAKSATGSATGVNNETLNPAVTFKYTGVAPTVYPESTEAPVNAGTYSVVAVFAGNNSYNAGESQPGQFTIQQAAATISIVPYTGAYDGAAHTASGTATGVNNVNLSSGLSFASSYTNVPGGSTNWSFEGGTNYRDSSGTVAVNILQAPANITIVPYSGAYDGAAHTASGTASGVNNENLNSGLSFASSYTNAPGGSTNWSFEGGVNYRDSSGTTTVTIGKINATISVNGYTGVFDGLAHGASGSATGLAGVDLSSLLDLGASFTNVPGGTANWSFAGNTNYNSASGTASILITKADATISVTGYTGVYDGQPHGATGSATGVSGESLAGLSLGASYTNVPGGTANWSFTDATGNYNNASGSVQIVITKASATISVNGYTGVYDGQPHGASGTATGVGGVDLSNLLDLGASFTNVPGGTANWSFAGNTNYNSASGTASIVITKADATISVTGYTGVYDGQPHGATGSATGVSGESLAGLSLGASYTNVPGGTANWTFTDATGNYNNASGSVAIVITKASATLSLSNLNHVYDGTAKYATATTDPSGLSGVSIAGNGQTNAGTYQVTASLNNTNYQAANVIGSLFIDKASSFVNVTGGTYNFDGQPKPASASVIGINGATLAGATVTFLYTGTGSTIYNSSTAPSMPGTYLATGTFAGNSNYYGSSGQASITINQTCPTLTHDPFSSFTDANPATGQNAPTTTMWVQVKLKINGQLMNTGDYIDYGGGTVHFTNIKTDAGNSSSYVIPRGRVIAGTPLSPISSSYDMNLGMWVTIVPANLNTTSDIFISGAIVNSNSGFKKLKNTQSSTYITGSFTSNVPFSSRWLYSMAAYQVPGNGFTYASLSPQGSVVAVNSQPYGSGTPMPHVTPISYLVPGGNGNGNGNYTGNTSSLDNFTACSTTTTVNPALTRVISEEVKKAEPVMSMAPNPSRDHVTISYVPAVSGKTSVQLFQINGVEAGAIFEGLTDAGKLYNWKVNTGRFAAGVYLVRLVNNGEVITKKLVIVN